MTGCDPYEDADEPRDCCPWREPVDQHNKRVDRIACEVLGHRRKSDATGYTWCARCIAFIQHGEGGPRTYVYDNSGFRGMIDAGMMGMHGGVRALIVNLRDTAE